MFQLPFETQASSFIALYLSWCFYQVGCIYPDRIRTSQTEILKINKQFMKIIKKEIQVLTWWNFDVLVFLI